MSTWVRQVDGQDVDLETIAANRNTIKVNDVDDGEGSGDNKIALHTKNSSTAANARAFRAEGKSDVLGDFLAGPGGGSLLLTANKTELGKNDVKTSIKGDNIHLERNTLILGLFDSDAEAEDPLDLEIGTQESTKDVKLSRTGKTTTVQGKLEVDEGIEDVTIKSVKVGQSGSAGEIDSNGTAESKQDLKIGSGAGTDSVIIGKQDHTAIVDCNLRVGRNDIGGVHTSRIDAYGNNGAADHLNIGTQNHTNDVRISRSGQKALVQGDLQVDEELRVGPTGSAGKIDAGGTGQAQDLKIGTNNTTDDVILGRAGQTIDMFGQARVNSNAVIMNDADAITDNDGCGMLFNAVGHPGPAMPCIDFYINGAVVGYVDANGWNNA